MTTPDPSTLHPVQESTFQAFAWLWSILLVGILGTMGWIVRQVVHWKQMTDERLARLEDHDQLVAARLTSLEADRDRCHPRETWDAETRRRHTGHD